MNGKIEVKAQGCGRASSSGERPARRRFPYVGAAFRPADLSALTPQEEDHCVERAAAILGRG
jgi:hypothetical protein